MGAAARRKLGHTLAAARWVVAARPMRMLHACFGLLACLASRCVASGNATIRLDRARYPMDIAAPFSVTVADGAALPPPPLFVTLRRAKGSGCFVGRSPSPGGAGFNCYASYALRLPPIGDNFKKNQTYDFEVVEVSPKGEGALPRAATPGNTSLCLSSADGTCLPGFEPALFEHFVGAAVEFSYRPYIEESSGAILVTLDASLAAASVKATIGGAVEVSGAAMPGVGTLVPFSLEKLPLAVDELVNITVSATLNGERVDFVHERVFLRAQPPREGSAATTWQVDHSRSGLRVDGKRFFGTGWFGAGGEQGVGSGLPPNAFLPFLSPDGVGAHFNVSDSALRQASLLSEWGKMGVNLVRVGAMYTSGDGPTGWSEESCADALREFIFVADAAYAAGKKDLPCKQSSSAIDPFDLYIIYNTTGVSQGKLRADRQTYRNSSLFLVLILS